MNSHAPDVLIVGTGQAGVPLATRLAATGRRVVIVERSHLGGTCANTGCTPTKTMIASARAAHVARSAGRLGVRVDRVDIDLPAIVDRKDAIVRSWREGIAQRLEQAGERLHLRRGHARFSGRHQIDVDGERFTAETIILDVGARAAIPRLAGIETVAFLDNASALALREVPSHLLIVGGGYVGCELGQMFRRFGAEVTIVDHHPHLLAREDADISSALEEAFRAEGIHLELSSAPESVRKESTGLTVHLADGRNISASHLLLAAGRRPNTDDLGCEQGGIALDRRGFIVTDDGYATSDPGVFAVGDATGGPQFTHSSWDDHRILYDRLLGKSSRGRSSRIVPFCVFTGPQVAGVGITEHEARAKHIAHEMATMPFREIARAIEVDERAGLMKILIDPSTERILGCRIVGAEAGELIHVFVALIAAGASARAIVTAEAIHPTFAEGLQSLVMRIKRFALS